MVDQSKLSDALSDYVRTLTSGYDIGRRLYDITERAVTLLGCSAAGISLRDGDGLTFVTSTDGLTAAIEERRAGSRSGPCWEAYRSRRPVTSGDLSARSRWPDYGRRAADHGIRSVTGHPLVTAGESIGVLGLYWDEPHRPDPDEAAAARLLAGIAVGYVVNLRLDGDPRGLADRVDVTRRRVSPRTDRSRSPGTDPARPVRA